MLVSIARDIEAAKIAKEELAFRKSTQSDRVKSIEDEIAEYEKRNEVLMANINDVKSQAEQLRTKAASSNENIGEQIENRNNLEKRSGELRILERTKARKEKTFRRNSSS